ncbi:MAG TPA: hypothetical protein VNA89_12410 [Gemmatimonadaceae bacterium]|nr:hypothetical protein [Gemmatimonadaceae bacterium]
MAAPLQRLFAAALACGTAACADRAAFGDTRRADSDSAVARWATPLDSIIAARCRSDSAFAALVRADSAALGLLADSTAARDSAAQRDSAGAPATDSTRAADSAASAREGGEGGAGTAARKAPRGSAARRPPVRRAAASYPRPRRVPPIPGSVLPGCRIVAFYGNPLSRRMGILGEIHPDSMLARLERQAEAWAAADSGTPVVPALHLIATVAQAGPGPGGLYRLRMSDTLIERVMSWAEKKNYLFFLDVQIGKSTLQAELEPIRKYLARPHVHLGLDPEFSMKGGQRPGTIIGTMDARDVNYAVDLLAKLVDEHKLPPKVLVVHRFTNNMLTNQAAITLDPRVQVVINMDGFGPPRLKLDSYRAYISRQPVQYHGFKLFYKNDKPIMQPSDVIHLEPEPFYIQYQ